MRQNRRVPGADAGSLGFRHVFKRTCIASPGKRSLWVASFFPMARLPQPLLIASLAFGLGLSTAPWLRKTPAASVPKSVQAHFSPKGGCTDALVDLISSARKKVQVQAYSFTSTRIAEALVAAARRGVAVEVILDKSHRTERFAAVDVLARAGIPLLVDARHAIAHNKVLLVDGERVVTGSFNFTKAAESANAENLLILNDPELVARYSENFLRHRGHSEPYSGR